MNNQADYSPLLPGIGFSGYRSFNEWQEFLFPSKVTILAGTNNCGKSNVLRYLQYMLPQLRSPSHQGGVPVRPGMADIDYPRGFGTEPQIQCGIPIKPGTYGDIQDFPGRYGRVRGSSIEAYKEALIALLADVDGYYWSRFTVTGESFAPPQWRVQQAIDSWPQWHNDAHLVMNFIGGSRSSSDFSSVMIDLMRSIGGFSKLPRVATISSARHVEVTDDSEADWLSGKGIIRELGAIQNPAHGDWDSARSRWNSINRFVQNVLGDFSASLNIPYDFSTIQVETPQRVLPLASLGSGVEQVIVLAAAATVTTNTLVCVEEPETNLHPLLQKKLVRYLQSETNNQYILATHSSHILDDISSASYHIRLTTTGSTARLARRPHQLIEVIQDLGYRPSDLLQANCVIWVEGPSDRIYIKRWLELFAPELSEGIDYSIMFYGGKLLAHLTTSEDALEEFISLRYLNRSSAVVIDSDRKNPHHQLSQTKRRIRKEFEEDAPAPGFAWVTKCYTIENYIPDEILSQAVGVIHPGVRYLPSGQWQNPLAAPKNSRPFDKVGIASQAAIRMTRDDLYRFDLRSKLTQLRKFVREANGKSIAPSAPER